MDGIKAGAFQIFEDARHGMLVSVTQSCPLWVLGYRDVTVVRTTMFKLWKTQLMAVVYKNVCSYKWIFCVQFSLCVVYIHETQTSQRQ